MFSTTHQIRVENDMNDLYSRNMSSLTVYLTAAEKTALKSQLFTSHSLSETAASFGSTYRADALVLNNTNHLDAQSFHQTLFVQSKVRQLTWNTIHGAFCFKSKSHLEATAKCQRCHQDNECTDKHAAFSAGLITKSQENNLTSLMISIKTLKL